MHAPDFAQLHKLYMQNDSSGLQRGSRLCFQGGAETSWALPCDSTGFQVTWRVSPPFLQRRVGFASPSLPALT